jgi:VIT1/CCC1 family predicted Fe2+/Mn2+ transporter
VKSTRGTDGAIIAEGVESAGRPQLPRIPDTPERRRLARDRRIREIVFGAQDGVLTTLGIVTGVAAAEQERAAAIITGMVTLLVGAISMGVGEYLGGKSEREVVQNAIALEARELREKPDEEFAEQVAYYVVKGFTTEEAQMITRRLVQNRDLWLYEMVRDEFGIDLRMAEEGGLGSAFAIGGSFAAAALFPVLPYLFNIPVGRCSLIGFALAAVALFAIGAYSGRLSGRNPLKKGFEIVAYGAAVFLVSYAAGRFIPPLFGHHPLTAG